MYEATLHFVAVCDYLAHGVPPTVAASVDAITRAHEQRRAWEAADPACLWPRIQRGDDAALATASLLIVEGVGSMLEDLAGSGAAEV